MTRAGQPGIDHVLGHGDQVVIDALAIHFQAGLVPGRTELAAAADICDDIGPAIFQPQPTAHARIGRADRHLKPAIGVEQGRRRPVHDRVFMAHDEIGHHRAVRAFRLELLDHEAVRVEALRR